MLQYFVDKLGASALIISQMLLTAVVGTEPFFEDVTLEVSGEKVFCSARLVESFTPDLDLMLQSGDTVVIHFELDLVNAATNAVVAIADWEHHFLYSILEDEYSVYRAEDDKTYNTNIFEDARQEWVNIETAYFCRVRVMEDDQQYFLRMSAFLEEMEMPGMTKRVNLMSFWNTIKPVHISEPFEKRQLVQ